MNRKRIHALSMVLLFLVVAAFPSVAAQSLQVPMAPNAIPQFAQQLPLLSIAGGTMSTLPGNQPITVHMCEFDAQVLPSPLPATRV